MNRSALRDPWDEDLSILSAENVNFAVETAGLGSRFSAAVIDLTIQALILTLLLLGANIFIDYLSLETWGRWARAIGLAALGLVLFVLLWGYYFLFEWLWDGQTPGKRWLGLRVMQTNGMPITLWAALTRNLLRIADFLPIFYGVGSLVAILNPNNRRAGDLVAGTIVAREQHAATRKVLSIDQAADNLLAQAGIAIKAATGVDVPAAVGLPAVGLPVAEATPSVSATAATATMSAVSTPPTIAIPAPEPDANLAALQMRLNAQDQDLLFDFLARRSQLPAEARTRLGASLAIRLCHKLQMEPPPPLHTEPFLEYLATTLRGGQEPLIQPLQ